MCDVIDAKARFEERAVLAEIEKMTEEMIDESPLFNCTISIYMGGSSVTNYSCGKCGGLMSHDVIEGHSIVCCHDFDIEFDLMAQIDD